MRREYEIQTYEYVKRKKKSFKLGRGFLKKPPSPIEVIHITMFITRMHTLR